MELNPDQSFFFFGVEGLKTIKQCLGVKAVKTIEWCLDSLIAPYMEIINFM